MAEYELQDAPERAVIEAENVTPMRVPAPAQLIETALRTNANVETLERLFALQERHEAAEARRQYVAALAQFKSLGVRVKKDRSVSQGAGRPSYKHATLANIVESIAPALAEYGLSATWQTSQEQHGITVTCVLRHAAGHSESVSLTGQPDTGPGRNAIQAIGSTITYLQRYTLMAITGVAATDQDDDGRGGASEYVSEEQAADITALMEEVQADREKLLRWIGAGEVKQIKAKDFAKVIRALEAKR